MKIILFCKLPYAFAIMRPIADEIQKQNFEYIWFVPKEIEALFPYKMPYTTNIKSLEKFSPDAIFVPGNEVPYWLPGVKVQIFHGLAGEKKGHFRIRHYFDLYLTQGPYFTNRFNKLAHKHQNFSVIQTGWSKLDTLFEIKQITKNKKEELKKEYNVDTIILYAPTFSPSLTSTSLLYEGLCKFAKENSKALILLKFHDKMSIQIVEQYKTLNIYNIVMIEEKDIIPIMQISDIMISDTSSVVYEFILLNKPVITLNSSSKNILWQDCNTSDILFQELKQLVNGSDKYIQARQTIIEQYHPYNDSKSSIRMINAVKGYIELYGVPLKRKLSLLRKWKINKLYKKSFSYFR